MVTIKGNERSKAGKALLEIARIFSMDKEGVEIVEPDAKSETAEKVPNAKTLKTFENTEKRKI